MPRRVTVPSCTLTSIGCRLNVRRSSKTLSISLAITTSSPAPPHSNSSSLSPLEYMSFLHPPSERAHDALRLSPCLLLQDACQGTPASRPPRGLFPRPPQRARE